MSRAKCFVHVFILVLHIVEQQHVAALLQERGCVGESTIDQEMESEYTVSQSEF